MGWRAFGTPPCSIRVMPLRALCGVPCAWSLDVVGGQCDRRLATICFVTSQGRFEQWRFGHGGRWRRYPCFMVSSVANDSVVPKGAFLSMSAKRTQPESGSTMLLNVAPLVAPDEAIQERVDAMERVRSTRETAMFDEVRCAATMAGCESVVPGGLPAGVAWQAAAELRSTIGFVSAELAVYDVIHARAPLAQIGGGWIARSIRNIWNRMCMRTGALFPCVGPRGRGQASACSNGVVCNRYAGCLVCWWGETGVV
jgi:hypothetical protein